MHYTPPYRRRDGTPVSGYTAGNGGRKSQSPEPEPPSPRKTRKSLAVGITVAIAGVGTVAVLTLTSGASGTSASLSDSGNARTAAEMPETVRVDLSHADAALVASGYKVNLGLRLNKNCSRNSYGAVRQFFDSHPCNWLARAYFAIGMNNRMAAVAAISWVQMDTLGTARRYKHVVDAPGTGNVTELSRVTGPYQHVRYTGEFYLSGIDGTSVWNAEVQPVIQLPSTVTLRILHDSEQ